MKRIIYAMTFIFSLSLCAAQDEGDRKSIVAKQTDNAQLTSPLSEEEQIKNTALIFWAIFSTPRMLDSILKFGISPNVQIIDVAKLSEVIKKNELIAKVHKKEKDLGPPCRKSYTIGDYFRDQLKEFERWLQNFRWHTPLLCAAIYRTDDNQSIQLLLEHGADDTQHSKPPHEVCSSRLCESRPSCTNFFHVIKNKPAAIKQCQQWAKKVIGEVAKAPTGFHPQIFSVLESYLTITPADEELAEILEKQELHEENIKKIQKLLTAGANPQGCNNNMWSLMCNKPTKEREQRVDVLKLLLEHRADPNCFVADGRMPENGTPNDYWLKATPLYFFANYTGAQAQRAAHLLIEHQADVNIPDKNCMHRTPLLMAASTSTIRPNTPMVTLLLEQGADVQHKDKDGRNFFDYASEKPELIEAYRAHKNNVRNQVDAATELPDDVLDIVNEY